MQFQVPQNITMEDKIVGPFTAIQFGIVLVGWGLSFFIATSTALPGILGKALGIFLALLTFVFAVGKFNDQPIYRFFKFFFSFLFKPKVRVWHKKGTEVHLIQYNPNAKAKDARHPVKNVSKKDIERLAIVLDSRGASGVVPKIEPPKSVDSKSLDSKSVDSKSVDSIPSTPKANG